MDGYRAPRGRKGLLLGSRGRRLSRPISQDPCLTSLDPGPSAEYRAFISVKKVGDKYTSRTPPAQPPHIGGMRLRRRSRLESRTRKCRASTQAPAHQYWVKKKRSFECRYSSLLWARGRTPLVVDSRPDVHGTQAIVLLTTCKAT